VPIPKSPLCSLCSLARAAMLALVLVGVGLGSAPTSASPARDTLVESIRAWAASQSGTAPAQVEVGPLDARLQVRDCGQPLAYDFPFTSRNTVRVRCTNPEWQLHIRVSYLQHPAGVMPQQAGQGGGSATGPAPSASAPLQSSGSPMRPDADRVTAVVPRSNLRAGQVLTSDLVETIQVDGRGLSRDLITVTDGLDQFEVVRPLRAGEPIRPTDLRPALLVRKGQSVVLSMRSSALNI
jgi:flagellar basal body P-ring formation protein FlgA